MYFSLFYSFIISLYFILKFIILIKQLKNLGKNYAQGSQAEEKKKNNF